MLNDNFWAKCNYGTWREGILENIYFVTLHLKKQNSTKNGIISFIFIKYCIDIGITWQQDGANIHHNHKFMDFLEQEFDGQVLGLGGDFNDRGGHS